VITYIKHGYQHNTSFGHRYDDIPFSAKLINTTKGTTNELTASEKKNYQLDH
jgi:hypothetical protein